ncbi:hypothetical protein [Leptospira santarosai]|uniref:hypothetical protein n=1 Tax=Leptospira santarosai TaxID=28183 RepID=UPI0026E15473|nr:hypothetical protein [Leptospira santarosai]MDO6383421.1 hypothetical protein [Leptospira santarosai]
MITLIRPNGSTIVGRPDGGIVPVDIDYGRPYARCPIQPGLISVAANSKNVTGDASTNFTLLKPGDYINLSPTVRPSQIESITNASSMIIKDPIEMALTNGVWKIAEQMYMGLTLETSMEESIGYADFKALQKGAQVYKKLVNSYMLTVKAKLIEPVAERLQRVIPGFKINYDQTTGNIKGAARTVPMWQELIRGGGQELDLTALIAPEVRSSDPMDKIIIPNALCYAEPKWEFTGEAGITLEVKWECFVSKDEIFAGYPLAWYMGDLDVT